MKDSDFAQTAGTLPDRLKQHLSDTAKRELDALRAALDSRLLALEAALAHPEPHESLESLVLDLARVATAEAEASAARASFEAERLSENQTAAATELDRLLELERGVSTAMRAELEDVRKKLTADLAREQGTAKKAIEKLAAAEKALIEARRLAQTRTSALDEARAAVAVAQQGAGEKVAAADSARAQAERAAQQAEARLRESDQHRHEADARAADADEKRKAAEERAGQADARTREAEARATAAEGERQAAATRAAQAEAATKDAEARAANAAARAMDALATVDKLNADLAAAKQAADRDRQAAEALHASHQTQLEDYQQRLAASVEQVRGLEVQLFRRDRPLQDRNENLSAMLARDLTIKSRRRTSRYSFAGTDISVDFGGEAGVLVDLSIAGAQLLSLKPFEKGRDATLTLLSDEVPVAGEARVIWTLPDADSKGQRQYRAGILFTAVDAAAVEAFIIRYSTP